MKGLWIHNAREHTQCTHVLVCIHMDAHTCTMPACTNAYGVLTQLHASTHRCTCVCVHAHACAYSVHTQMHAVHSNMHTRTHRCTMHSRVHTHTHKFSFTLTLWQIHTGIISFQTVAGVTRLKDQRTSGRGLCFPESPGRPREPPQPAELLSPGGQRGAGRNH